MKTPILGGSYVAASINAANDRMVNLYPEVTPQGGKEPAYLRTIPYLALYSDYPRLLTPSTFCRGLWVVNDSLYGVFQNNGVASNPNIGMRLCKFTENFDGTITASTIATLPDEIGQTPVSMADNGTQLFIACNPNAYIYNTVTGAFAKITDPDFPGAVTVGFLDGYFVFNQPNSQKLWVTALYDGTSVDPLDFASAEGLPDNIVSIMVDHREVWVFGTRSVEVWYNAGSPDFPLQRIQGAMNELGCAAVYSVAKLDNRVFWLGTDFRGQGMVFRANGYLGERVSTHAIETAIQSYSRIDDAVAFSYQQDGHLFYVLSFPSAQKTWVYDVATKLWHERAGGYDGLDEQDVYTMYDPICAINYKGKIVVGCCDKQNRANAALYYLTNDVRKRETEFGTRYLRSWRALETGKNNLKRTAHHSLQLDMQAGGPFQYFTGQNNTPSENKVALRWSDDGGYTWSNEHVRSAGATGQYGTRVIWRRLGMTTKLRDRVYEISGTQQVNIMGAELILSGTDA